MLLIKIVSNISAASASLDSNTRLTVVRIQFVYRFNGYYIDINYTAHAHSFLQSPQRLLVSKKLRSIN